MWLGLNVILQLADLPESTAESRRRLEIETDPEVDAETPELWVVHPPRVRTWTRSFEALLAVMEADGRIYSEGDGSFVLCGQELCAAANRETLWLGQLPQALRRTPTSGWRATPPAGTPAAIVWRIEGNIVDGAAGVDHITVHGMAPWAIWSDFLRLLRGRDEAAQPGTSQLVAQLHQFGLFVSLEPLLPST